MGVSQAIPNLPKELIDHPQYEVVRELGRGGMGVVYIARNRLLDRIEVLKVIGPKLVSKPESAERFLAEMRLAAKLNHSNVVTAYAALREGTFLAMAMEFVPGEDLARASARGPIPIPNACYYAAQAAAGLDHARQHGLVHRDIKPSNLMLSPAGKKPVVKVLDFGLAKATSERTTDDAPEGFRTVIGTPDFMAPEQFANAAAADSRADVYSLGCTLYFLLTGKPPFRGETPLEICRAHRDLAPPPIRALRSEVPAELAAVVMQMMAKEPGQRFATPGAAALALAPFHKHGVEPVLVRPAAPNAPAAGMTAPLPAALSVGGRLMPIADFAEVRPGDATLPPRSTHLNPEDFEAEAPPKSKRKTAPVSSRMKKRKKRSQSGSQVLALAIVGLIALGGLAFAGYVISQSLETSEATTSSPRFVPGELNPPPGPPKPEPAPKGPLSKTADGFDILFDGKSMDGWEVQAMSGGGNEAWTVQNGEIVSDGIHHNLLVYKPRKVTDFMVRLEAMIEKHDGGFFYRYDPLAQPGSKKAYEAQFGDSATVNGATGTLYTFDPLRIVSARNTPRPPYGKWFTMNVTARGDKHTVVVDGHITADGVDNQSPLRSGYIAFQQMGGLARVHIRRVELKDFEPEPNSPQFLPLFDGISTNGWKTSPAQPSDWRIENGKLVGRWKAGPSFLYTTQTLPTDLRVRAKVRINSTGSSGISVRSGFGPSHPTVRPVYPTGYECRFGTTVDRLQLSGAVFKNGIGQGLPGAFFKVGEWNTVEIEVRGKSVQTWVNGTNTARYSDTSSTPVLDSGLLALGAYNPGTMVEFESIEYRDLTGEKP